MNKAKLVEMKEDRLANTAVVAFLGALLMGQSWRGWEGSEGTTELLMFTVPDYSGLVIFTLMSGLFFLSLFLATASMVMPLQRWGLAATRFASPIMLPIVSASFILSLVSSTFELPYDQWWAPVLFIGGFVMFIFIGFRRPLTSFFKFLHQRVGRTAESKPIDDVEPKGPNDVELSETPDRMVLLERMRNLRAYFRPPESGEFWITLSVAVMVVEVLLVVVLWDWLAKDESGSATIRNIGLVIAGSLAIPLAIWRAVVAAKQASSAQRQTTTGQQGLLNERYQKAAEMLGNENLFVRLGGVYTLQALIEEYPEQYYVSCMRLLCAFVRTPPVDKHLPLVSEEETSGSLRLSLRGDVQAVMDMMRSRDDKLIAFEKKSAFQLDFRGAALKEGNLRSVNLSGADLRGANLSRAYAKGANLSHTGLSDANLSGAWLAASDLSGSYLDGTDISGTWFCDKSFSGGFATPAVGLTDWQLYRARAEQGKPPILGDVVLDAEGGWPLKWEPDKGEVVPKN